MVTWNSTRANSINFKIKEAAEVLRDPKLRLEHDESLESFHEPRNLSRVYRPRRQKEEWEEWAEDNPSWRNMDLNDNLRNSQDCYMYSFGSSVHMDPYSEESMAESARRSEEADKWQAEYTGKGFLRFIPTKFARIQETS